MAEHRAPERIEPQRLGDYLEIMTKVVFQSGMSWKVVESKWPGTRAAFRDFDAEAVAGLSPDQLRRAAPGHPHHPQPAQGGGGGPQRPEAH